MDSEPTDTQSLIARLDELTRDNRRLRLGLCLAVGVSIFSSGVTFIRASVADAQTSRTVTAERFVVEKNGVEYGAFGMAGNNVVFEMKKQASDGWRGISGFVDQNFVSFHITGPGDGPTSVEITSQPDGSGRIVVRDSRKEIMWSAP